MYLYLERAEKEAKRGIIDMNTKKGVKKRHEKLDREKQVQVCWSRGG